MKPLTIKASFPCDVTIISNTFLDEYMPRANGEFVKVYLYLLRLTYSSADAPSLCEIADKLNYTEQDVLRALRYWETERLLVLGYAEDGSLSGIAMTNLCARRLAAAPEAADPSVLFPAQDRPARKAVIDTPVRSDGTISASRLEELSEMEDIRELLFIVQQYLGKTLSPSETRRLLYFYEELHFAPDLIDYLVEYCVSKGHASIHYIEKVGLGWYEEGITTVRAARQSVSSYHKDYYEILQFFGKNDHHPIEAEIGYMKKWIETYAFPLDVISEAAGRAVMKGVARPFQYTDGILKDWNEHGVRTLADVRAEDEKHREAAQAKAENAAKPAPRRSGRNARPAEQHDYNFDEIDAMLIDRQKKGIPESKE